MSAKARAISPDQHEIIGNLTALGAPLELAIELLNLFDDMQASHIAHLKRLQSPDYLH